MNQSRSTWSVTIRVIRMVIMIGTVVRMHQMAPIISYINWQRNGKYVCKVKITQCFEETRHLAAFNYWNERTYFEKEDSKYVQPGHESFSGNQRSVDTWRLFRILQTPTAEWNPKCELSVSDLLIIHSVLLLPVSRWRVITSLRSSGDRIVRAWPGSVHCSTSIKL